MARLPLRTAANDPDAVRLGVGTTVEEAEKMLILKTLEATSNNKTRAAEILGISLKTLHNKLKEYGSASAEGRQGRSLQRLGSPSSVYMRRKTIIVLVITLMVTAMVSAFSYLYISQILRLRIVNAYETATSLTHQLAYAAGNAVPDFSSTSIDTSDPAAVKRALAEFVQTDVDLNNLLQSDPGDWRYIYDVAIVDTNGKALLHTNASHGWQSGSPANELRSCGECSGPRADSPGLQPRRGL